MTPAPVLNTLVSTLWMPAVSGSIWEEYALSEVGQVVVKGAHVQVGAKSHLTVPWDNAPSLLSLLIPSIEAGARKENLRAQFLAFVHAAHQKVRHSSRWKTPSKYRIRRAVKTYLYARLDYLQLPIFQIIPSDYHEDARIQLGVWYEAPEYMLRAFSRRSRAKIANIRRKQGRILAKMKWREDSLIDYAAPSHDDINSIDERFKNVMHALWKRELPSEDALRAYAGDVFPGKGILALGADFFSSLSGIDSSTGRAVWRLLRRMAGRVDLSAVLLHLKRAAYRAHVLGRLRSTSRRTRTPRPLYPRPRPPTAPLAPPAA
ncbi:hypothetical protein GO986_00110 [Deinococcus sp. HMF7620]|uniref:Uncharacterized protein n=1 Tax=Deinococcus arboris TaxID=2682977 RepID=A0A7C9HX87_9DEIO|nr:hypothetical protein [Deinococcus arboris]MVN85175.1 hypothetical protein [Deinococcus arboris]